MITAPQERCFKWSINCFFVKIYLFRLEIFQNSLKNSQNKIPNFIDFVKIPLQLPQCSRWHLMFKSRNLLFDKKAKQVVLNKFSFYRDIVIFLDFSIAMLWFSFVGENRADRKKWNESTKATFSGGMISPSPLKVSKELTHVDVRAKYSQSRWLFPNVKTNV